MRGKLHRYEHERRMHSKGKQVDIFAFSLGSFGDQPWQMQTCACICTARSMCKGVKIIMYDICQDLMMTPGRSMAEKHP